MTFNSYLNGLNPEIKEYFNILSPTGFPSFLIPFIESKTMMRLKNISYFCGMQYASKNVYNFKYKLSRLDHSISTALIVWNHTFNVKETLAALFHDASTPAFSHVIDYMNKDYKNEESTELDLMSFLSKDHELIELLNSNGIKTEDIANFKDYSLVDNSRPKLCADRLDGLFLPNLIWTQKITLPKIKEIYDDIIVKTNEDGEEEFVFMTPSIADEALELNDIINHETHSDNDYISMNLLASMTKRLIDLKVIEYKDLYTLDDEAIFKIITITCFKDSLMKEMYHNFTCLLFGRDKQKEEIKDKKLDPLVLEKRKIVRLSNL
jgi:hypothetical protein